MPILQEVNHFIDAFLRGQSVPIYFFISGFVFFLGIQLTREKYIQKLRNRVKTLLIPYIIWNVIGLLLTLIRMIPSLSSIFPNAQKIGINISLSSVLYTFWDSTKGILLFPTSGDVSPNPNIYPLDIPLWFVRDLMIVVLLTPVIYWLLKHLRHYFVLTLGMAWFVMGYWELGHPNQLITAFFFFSWGAYMSVSGKDMMREFSRYAKPSAVLYLLLSLTHVASVHYFPEFTSTIKRLNVFVGLFFAYNLSSWLLRHKVCKVSPLLASSSFFIYVAHTLINGDVLKCLFFVLRPSSDLAMLSIYALAVVLTVGLLLLTFCLLRRFTPKLLTVLVGRKAG